MPDTKRHVRVFLASPGDLAEERKLAKTAVDQFNSLFADHYGYQVDLIGWEDTVSMHGRPQEIINKDLARCELFIGILWKRWGTPPDNQGIYSSGFEEEFRLTLARRGEGNTPEMSILFKEVPPELLRDPGDQLKKVIAFRQELVDKKYLLFENFADVIDFERKFFRCIANYVNRLGAEEKERSLVNEQASKVTVKSAAAKRKAGDTPLSAEGAEFASNLIVACEERPDEVDKVSVARFRLLGSLLHCVENDSYRLGVHDANILYQHRATLKLGNAERIGLLKAGLGNVKEENTPAWYWLASHEDSSAQLLMAYSVAGEPGVQYGAITAMRFLAVEIPSEFDREAFVRLWLGSERSSELRTAALSYLSKFGVASDVQIIRAEFEQGNGQAINASAEAIVRIAMRDGKRKAFEALFDLRPTSVSKSLIQDLFFDDPAKVPDDFLLESLRQPCGDIRLAAVRLGYKRKIFTMDQSDKLVQDDYAHIRRVAIEFLVDNGRPFTDKEIEEIINKPSTNAMSSSSYLSASGDHIEELKLARLLRCGEVELEDVASRESIFGYQAHVVMAERSRKFDLLRSWVDNRFVHVYENEWSKFYERFKSDQEFISSARDLELYSRKRNTRLALDALERLSDPSDIHRIRALLKDEFVDTRESDVEYLGRFGDWSDVQLILKARGRFSSLGRLLIQSSSLGDEVCGAAMFNLGKARVAELLRLDMPDSLRMEVLSHVSKSTLRSLADDVIVDLLRLNSDGFRRLLSIKCVQSLPKARVKTILDSYLDGGHQIYYNAIFWLDLAVAFIQPESRAIATRVAAERS